MKRLTLSFIFIANYVFNIYASDYDPDVYLTTPQMIRRAGYPAEAHTVETDDGYLLTMHRIPGPPGSLPVFLQHGFLGSSADWVITGRGHSLAYILADKGYDVWLGNFRGNTYSRAHVTLATTDSKFWDFSWHEMGMYDLPAEISYISNLTNHGICYIGHSMGTTAFYVMAAMRPDISKNVKGMLSLAPIAFMSHLKSPALRIIAPFAHDIQVMSHFFGADDFLPNNEIMKLFSKYVCDRYAIEEKLCANILFVVCGFDAAEFNYTLVPKISSHTPAGSSTKAAVHYTQEILSGRFRQYDYGTEKNMQIYNAPEPPDYNISSFQIPIGIFYSENDWLASIIDVAAFYDKVPKKLGKYKIEFPQFNHLDFIWGKDAPKMVYEKLYPVIQNIFF